MLLLLSLPLGVAKTVDTLSSCFVQVISIHGRNSLPNLLPRDLRPVQTARVDAPSNQTSVKDRRHSHRPRRRASTNLHKSNERCQFKLYISYWTSNNNKWPKCSCQTLLDNTCANDVIDNAMT